MGGGPFYPEMLRAIKEKRKEDAIVSIQRELETRLSNERTKLINKWKRLRPTLRSYGKKLLNRYLNGAAEVLVMPSYGYDRRREQHWDYPRWKERLDEVMETPIADRRYQFELTTSRQPAAEVAARARAELDPYYLLICSLPDDVKTAERVQEALGSGYYGRDSTDVKPRLVEVLVPDTQVSTQSLPSQQSDNSVDELQTLSRQVTPSTPIRRAVAQLRPPSTLSEVDGDCGDTDDEGDGGGESDTESLDALQADWYY